ncbi:MAG: FecR domain-containing protein [Polyangiaceae bacterium]|nr:FecR domain-containing protein [Polyangiaceae bacterium]
MMRASRRLAATLVPVLLVPQFAGAQTPPATPGYPEPVVQWGVQKDETCEDVAKAVYGSAKHASLVLRYNRVDCTRGKKLKEGQTLVLPASVTNVPTARLRSINPDVKSKPPGGGWGPAAAGQPLSSNSGVSTLDQGRADIEFIDRTRVFLASNTLVIIYGTASQSAVSKTTPAAVEVQSGEVMAGLAALRGSTVEVAVKGGGRVSATSRETLVERKGERTTVGVYDGKANVSAGGKTVSVPTNHGTRYTGNEAPSAPRPLPPAPGWAPTTSLFVIASSAGGQIKAEWNEVKDAKAYRVELSRDEGFRDLIAREEVPGNVHSFRADKMPPGRYFVSVRAIDKEEYLGIASKRAVDVVQLDLGVSGAEAVTSERIVVSPYATLTLKSVTKMDFALDDGPFGPMPSALDLTKRAPNRLRFKPADASTTYDVAVQYVETKAAVVPSLSADGNTANVDVTFTGLEGVDVAGRVAPMLRVTRNGAAEQVPLALKDGHYVAAVPAPSEGSGLRADVVDSRGYVLGTGDLMRPKVEKPKPPTAPVKIPSIGFTTEEWQPSSVTGIRFWSPTARNAGNAAVQTQIGSGGAGFRFQGSATGGVGPLGFDATIRSHVLGYVDGSDPNNPDPVQDDSAWLGARARLFRVGNADLEAGIAARFGFPVGANAPGERVEFSAALGGVVRSYTWLVNIGARARVGDGGTFVPDDHLFLLAGGTATWRSWLRFGAALDAHLVRLEGTDANGGDMDLRGGLSLQAEAGAIVYGAIALRLSPWEDDGSRFASGIFSGQIALGLRAP